MTSYAERTRARTTGEGAARGGRLSRTATLALAVTTSLSLVACSTSAAGPGSETATPTTAAPTAAPSPSAPEPTADPVPSPDPAPSPDPEPSPDPTPERAETNVPMTRLAPGEQPPQFIIFSFDGAGWHDRWQEFSAAAEEVDARFTGFLTGIYLLTDEHRDAYTGPGHAPGRASVGFGGSPEDVTTLVEDLNGAYRAGHEIGTHYNGHFCADNPPGAGDWSTADWTSELDQFFAFWEGWREINMMPEAQELEVPASEVRGGRTPCLEGDWEQIAPAWAEHGLTYDSSIPGSGMAWPTQQHGVWEFAMQSTASPTLGNVTAMDYNFWYKFNQAQDQPERAGEIHDAVLETYRHMYQATSTGNRAPVLVANHFNAWSGNAFNPAARDFMLEACDDEGTVCATYSDVIAWMELQDPAVLAELQSRPPVY
ncbi:polysaccharide deacetylase [Sanguibacter keddieii]|uniref:polysaccharide deacetylase n=1 Tax=Sanguibacter keddieii TaxID=60920 RepID=UPI0015752A41|nr:polysaccharide deacetylase [Sanguibacter keddieii]